jgi:hypothetical protein
MLSINLKIATKFSTQASDCWISMKQDTNEFCQTSYKDQRLQNLSSIFKEEKSDISVNISKLRSFFGG